MWNNTKGEQDNLCLALINPRLCKKLSIKKQCFGTVFICSEAMNYFCPMQSYILLFIKHR